MLQKNGHDVTKAATLLLRQRELAPTIQSDDAFHPTSTAQYFQMTSFARQRAFQAFPTKNCGGLWHGPLRREHTILASDDTHALWP